MLPTGPETPIVPTLVIHGDSDPLVPLSGGQATARAIPNARLHVIEGLGHDLPPRLHDTFRDLIVGHVQSVQDGSWRGR